MEVGGGWHAYLRDLHLLRLLRLLRLLFFFLEPAGFFTNWPAFLPDFLRYITTFLHFFLAEERHETALPFLGPLVRWQILTTERLRETAMAAVETRILQNQARVSDPPM